MESMKEPARLTVGDSSPYEAFTAFGVSYHSSMREINRAAQEAQKQRKLGSAGNKAWAELRNAEKRLLHDFFHLQTDPTVFGEPAVEAQVPEPLEPPLQLPPLRNPEPSALVKVLGFLDPGVKPPLPAVCLPPPLDPPLWDLLGETLGMREPDDANRFLPNTFLEDE
jgi:hypothetical protein